MDKRARTHIKAIATEIKTQVAEDPEHPGTHFLSGMLTGLAAAVQIADGKRAEEVLEEIDLRMTAAVGDLYLAGKLTDSEQADS